jgi:hypothetical protein
MKIIKNIVESASDKVLLFLICGSLILNSNCGGSRIERISEPPTKISPTESSEDFPFIKLHMKNGDLYVLNNWIVDSKSSTVNGTGKLVNANREIISEGQFTVPVKEIVIAETNHIKSSSAVGTLTVLTIVTGIFTVVCIVNPKACFGSCPTFYASNGDDFIVQSEGFSSSISPALEEKDIDALYRIKPNSSDFTIQLKNEAYETHVIRSANILALPKPEGGRVFSSPNGEFYQAKNIADASSVIANEGDISEKVCSFDGVERFSKADSNYLATKEIIELTFNPAKSDSLGLVIAARQTLLTTFLFYQTLAYMGTTAGDWLANVERNGDQFKSLLKNPRNTLGNIDVLIENENNEWVKVGEVGETGPIATDIKIVPLKNDFSSAVENSTIKIRLSLSKGLWRIDYLALAELKNKVTPIVIEPTTVVPQFLGSSNVVELLSNPDSVLVTFPGDQYLLNYKLPDDYYNYELFMESQGYYLEWMRNEWLAEENPGKVYQMLFNPKQYYKDLAPQFKNVEAEMEETFWSSKYVYP